MVGSNKYIMQLLVNKVTIFKGLANMMKMNSSTTSSKSISSKQKVQKIYYVDMGHKLVRVRTYMNTHIVDSIH